MSPFEAAMQVALALPQNERERLAQALGVLPAAQNQSSPLHSGGRALPLATGTARPDPIAWRKAETGHAVLNTGGAATNIAGGANAIAGMWAHRRDAQTSPAETPQSSSDNFHKISALPPNSPVLIHTDLCVALALGEENARQFFAAAPVEIRLATASYLALLGSAENEEQMQRLRAFVGPFAVLSLGPMASSRAVELMLSHALQNGLAPLDALIAATALAHEIPLAARNPRPFSGIAGLEVCAL